MAKAKKDAVKAPEAVQDAPELQDAFQDIQEPDAIPEGVEAPAEGAGEIIGPEKVESLLGCQDDPEPEPPVQYAVCPEGGLNMRMEPDLAADILATLPCDSGVTATGVTQGPWTEVVTGRLVGWVLREFLEPLWFY